MKKKKPKNMQRLFKEQFINVLLTKLLTSAIISKGRSTATSL